MQTIETILRSLAAEDLRKHRTQCNQTFMCYGPGPEWNAWKSRNAAIFARIDLLTAYLRARP